MMWLDKCVGKMNISLGLPQKRVHHKFVLFQYTDKKSEIEDLKNRIEKIKHRGYIIADSVKGSSKYPPYNIKNYVTIGFDDKYALYKFFPFLEYTPKTFL